MARRSRPEARPGSSGKRADPGQTGQAQRRGFYGYDLSWTETKSRLQCLELLVGRWTLGPARLRAPFGLHQPTRARCPRATDHGQSVEADAGFQPGLK